MSYLIRPKDYRPLLGGYETEQGIKVIKDFFQDNLATGLHLRRVTGPLFVLRGLGINDDLNGTERPVTFGIGDMDGAQAEVVHSLAKWKRLTLAEQHVEPGYGIYTDMNAIRADEELGNLHSLYVDQWDWERVIRPEDRTLAFLKRTVRCIYAAMLRTEFLVCERFPQLRPQLPEEVTFIHAEELRRRFPDLSPKDREDRIAREANTAFALNLAESLAIVVALIMLLMGVRAGVLIGSSLLFSIGGTLLLMLLLGEGLNRTSLAGFIIAMGMLVDNAIVVTDNARQAMLRGVACRRALVEGANGPRWSLLGATLIAIVSFLPLYLAPSAVAEIVKPLFVVLAVSLLLSWLLALTQTPLMGELLLRTEPRTGGGEGAFFRRFNRLLGALLRHRWRTVAVALLLFALSLWTMGRMPQNFFPEMDKPYFRADVLLPEGYGIRSTEQVIERMEGWLRRRPEVKNVSATMGSTPPRYYLASGSVTMKPNFGNLLVELRDRRQTRQGEEEFGRYVRAEFPDVWLRSSLFKLSPVPDAVIEFGFVGHDPEVLCRLTEQVERIMWRTPGTENIRNSWGNRIPTWMPVYSQMKGQRIGVNRSQMAQDLTVATQGFPLGEFREGDLIMPILLKDENLADYNLTNLQTLPLFTPAGRVFSLGQATDDFRFDFRTGVIRRYNRERVMKAQCDPAPGVNAARLFATLRDEVRRTVELPEGYTLRIFGEEESREESNAALMKYLPLTAAAIFFILLLLFGNYRDPVAVLLLAPLLFIGVVAGLLVTGRTFNFFALLGLIGLAGMYVKNAVVLVEQIGTLRAAGRSPYEALVEATRSRIVPVVSASGTTVLGMLPLLFDSMFGAMAATIMGGLLAATLLTILVLPVVYALFHKIRLS